MPRSYRGSIHRRGWAVLRAEGHDILRTRLSWSTLCILLSVLWTPCVWPFTSLQWRRPFFVACFRRVRDHPPRRGPGPPVMGVARAGRPPSHLHGRRDRAIIRLMNVSKSIPDCIDPWTDTLSNCWPLDEHHFAEVFPECSSVQTDDPPLWSGLTPFALLPSL